MENLEEIEQKLKKIKEEVINCRKCPLYKTRIYPVIGQGNYQEKIVFVGEGPGYWEDQKGEPFVGAAGKVLDELLDSVGIKRENVYITNILKCRPPNNRNPQKEEIEACVPYLERQIEIISPEVICALGNFATRFIFKKYNLENQLEGISKIHGKIFESKSLFQTITLIPLYHPAVATYNANMKEILKKDFKILEKCQKN